MVKDLASIVLCTYNRAHLLRRSLICYLKQTEKNFELLVLDDGSEDDTKELLDSYNDRIDIKYIRLEDKKPGEWRDAGSIINRGIIMSRGEFVYITHPEVMICFDCIERSNAALRENQDAYLNSRVYYMTGTMQDDIENVDWQDNFYNIRKVKTFYDNPEPLYREEHLGLVMNPFCTPAYAESCDVWDSWVFGGMVRHTWKNYGGMNESPHWGTVDFDFMQRRRLIKFKTISPKDMYVIHQNHDQAVGKFKPTVRNLESMLSDSLSKYARKRNFLKDMEL